MNVNLNDPNVVLELMTTAVDEQGADYTYESEYGDVGCEYFVDEKSACIVGRVLDYAGVEFDFDTPLGSRYGTSKANDSDIVSVAPYVGIKNPKVVEILRDAQYAQDNGETWGYALNRAFERAINND